MSLDWQALGLRAVACSRWKWCRGMRIMNEPAGLRGTVLDGGDDYVIWQGEGSTREGGGWHEAHPVSPNLVPDLRDDATIGCLVALVRRALGKPVLHVDRWEAAGEEGWIVESSQGRWEAEALVVVLEGL